jgi:hypothetical protein
LLQEAAHRACRSSKTDEHHGKADNEGQRGFEQAPFRLLTLAKLLDADPGKHRDVAGDQRKNARRKKRNDACHKSAGKRDVVQGDIGQ